MIFDTLGHAPNGGGRGVEITLIPHAAPILAGVLMLATLALLAWWDIYKRKDRE